MSRKSNSRLHCITGILLGSASWATFSGVGYAQEDTETLRQEAVVVTARFREESAQDIGGSLQSFGSEDIVASGIADFEDVARRTPSLDFLDRGPNQNEVSMRGISKSVPAVSSENLSTQTVVTSFLDDIPISSPNPSQRDVPTYDLNRIEVLRGPQPTYFGEGSVGGSIRYFSAEPTLSETPSGIVAATISTTEGGSESYQYSGTGDVSLKPETLGLRVTGFYRKDGGFVDYLALGQDDANDYESYGGRAVLLYRPTEDFSLKAFAHIIRDETGGLSSVTPGIASEDDPSNNDPVEGAGFDDFDLYGLNASYDFGPIKLTSITGYYERQIGRMEYSSAYSAYSDALNGLTGSVAANVNGAEEKSFTQEIRFVTNFDGPLSFAGGLFYKNAEYDLDVGVDVPQLASVTSPATTGLVVATSHGEREQTSLFAEGTYEATENLRFILGARQVWEDQFSKLGDDALVVQGRTPVYLQPIVEFYLGGSGADQELNKLLGRGAVEFDATDNMLLYASVAQGARNGGLNAPNNIVFSGLGADYLVYDEDSVIAYEAGMKSTWFDGDLILNLALFRNDWSDVQSNLSGPAISGAVVANAGDAQSTGFEVETNWSVNEYVNLFFGGAYVDAEYSKGFIIPEISSEPQIDKGAALPGVPEKSFSIGGDVRYPISGTSFDVTARADYQYVDERSAAAAYSGIYALPEMSLANIGAGLENETWSLNLFVKNLTNEVKPQAAAFAGSTTPAQYFVNRPRTVGLSIRAKF